MKCRYLVAGRVQGVGFRAFVLRRASGLGLRGYCRNLLDGRVEVVVEGEGNELQALELDLARGPRLASVIRVEKHEILDDMTTYNSFHIL